MRRRTKLQSLTHLCHVMFYVTNSDQKFFNYTLFIADGMWTAWASPDAMYPCSTSCGGGIYNATRNCTNPEPGPGGKPCDGLAFNASAVCNTQDCPDCK